MTADGTLAEGEQVIGGKYYYFGERDYDKGRGIPYLLTGIVEYDGNTYLCGPDGAWIATVSNLKDGWFNAGGTWYYIEDKQLVIDEEKTISDKHGCKLGCYNVIDKLFIIRDIINGTDACGSLYRYYRNDDF